MKNFEYEHAVGATLDYSFDWGGKGWLKVGEVITTSLWTVPIGLTLVSQQNTGSITTVFVSGGVEGKVYEVKNTITTNNITTPRVDSRTIILSCKKR